MTEIREGYADYVSDVPDSWLARWDSALQGLAKAEDNAVKIGNGMYPVELANEVRHLMTLDMPELDVLNMLVTFWMAKKDSAKDETDYGVNRTVEAIWTRIGYKDIRMYGGLGFLSNTILKIRNDDTTALTDDEKENTLRVMSEAVFVEADKGNICLAYQIDWDVARLGFPEQYHEKEKAWQSIQYRFSNGLQDIDSITEAHVFVQNARDFSEYQKFVGENEKYAKELANDALKRYPSLRKLTGRERAEKLEEKCFNLWQSRKKMGMLGTEERWRG